MCKNVGLDECDCGFNDEAAAPVAAAESSCRLVRRQYMVQPAIGRAVQPIVQAVSPPNIEGAPAQTETQIRTPIEPQTQAPADCMGYPSIYPSTKLLPCPTHPLPHPLTSQTPCMLLFPLTQMSNHRHIDRLRSGSLLGLRAHASATHLAWPQTTASNPFRHHAWRRHL